MKKYSYIAITFILTITIILLIPVSGYNGGWTWRSQVEPLDILPIIVLFTLLTETLLINFVPKLRNLTKVFLIVMAGNLLSFISPYLKLFFVWLEEEIIAGGASFELLKGFSLLYTTGILFLVVTLLMETPMVYFALRNKAEKDETLLVVTIVANVLTTVVITIIERTLCYGCWQW